jgi:hypothetical protein
VPKYNALKSTEQETWTLKENVSENILLCVFRQKGFLYMYKQNKTYFADADAIPSKYTRITGYEKQKESSLSAKQHTERPNVISCTFMYNFVHVFPTWFPPPPSSANQLGKIQAY